MGRSLKPDLFNSGSQGPLNPGTVKAYICRFIAGFLILFIGLCIYFYANTILFWLLLFYNIVWNQDAWRLKLHSFSRLLWLFRFFCGSIWVLAAKSWLTGKDPDTGKYWRQKEKGATEVDMVRSHDWLNGHESEQAPGDRGRQEPGALQSMGSQRAGHNLVTEQQ